LLGEISGTATVSGNAGGGFLDLAPAEHALVIRRSDTDGCVASDIIHVSADALTFAVDVRPGAVKSRTRRSVGCVLAVAAGAACGDDGGTGGHAASSSAATSAGAIGWTGGGPPNVDQGDTIETAEPMTARADGSFAGTGHLDPPSTFGASRAPRGRWWFSPERSPS
jgi:hypothetical protein